MITLANGNVYSMQSFTVNTNTGSVQVDYTVHNPTAATLGFPDSGITLEIGMMPAIQAAFANPTTTGLPLFPAYEEWLVSDHSANTNESHLQFLTGGTIS